jgi:hypothetical protein
MSNKAAYLNEIANSPEVLRYVAPGYASVDMSGFFESPGNVMVSANGGCVLFADRGEGVYEGHYLLTYALRGAKAMRFLRAALDFAFTVRGASAIVGDTPLDNRAARAVTRALGFLPVGERVDTSGRYCVSYRMERSRWAQLSVGSLGVSAASWPRTSKPAHSDTQPIRPDRLH